MNWSSIKKKIRRFLRDPDGNIWESHILKRLYNDEQASLCNKSGMFDLVSVVRVPPMYRASYLYDWEWRYVDQGGKNYQCLRYHEQSDMAFCYIWEDQELGLSVGSESAYGDSYTHPFEAWYCSTPGVPVPIWYPENFRKTKFIAWDRHPIEPISFKDLTSTDPSWFSRAGVPTFYYQRDNLSNEFYLYPHVSSPVWDDISGDKLEGQVIFDDSNTESAEVGQTVDITSQVMNQDEGLEIESLSEADNVLIVYEAESKDVDTDVDTGSLPPFLNKYCEYAVLERAYSMNNDGNIESLRDYWSWRKRLGLEVIKSYRSKRRTDRDYQLVTKEISGRRSRRHPRLPDTYPAMP